MPARGPYTLQKLPRRFQTLSNALASARKRPPIGLTQGGSSKGRYKGAKVAATNAIIRQR